MNANGLADREKRVKVLQLLKEMRYDILFLQETHFSECREWSGDAFYAFHSVYSAGVAILFSRGLQAEPALVHSSEDGRLCVVDIHLDNRRIRLINVYAPNNPQERVYFFNERIEPFLTTDGINVLGGDFNCVTSVLNDSLRHSPNTLSQVGSDELLELTERYGLVDTYRSEFPEGSELTWIGHNGRQGSRIDRFFVPSLLKTKSKFETFPYSDHKVVICDIKSVAQSDNVGTSYFKLNTSVLNDTKYKKVIRDLLEESRTIRELFESTAEWWDEVKRRIRSASVSYCSNKRKQERADELYLKDKLKVEKDQERAMVLKNDLKKICDKRLNALAVRARSQFDSESEKPTAYFYSKIRGRREKNEISEVLSSEGVVQKEIQGILGSFESFYRSLYSRAVCDELEQTNLLDDTDVRDEQKIKDDSSFFTRENLQATVGDFKNNKTPGPDGLPVEFYKVFFPEIYDILLDIFNDVILNNNKPSSMQCAVTVLLPKGGDRRQPSNYRPITLLNTDYKILAKYLNKFYFADFLTQVVGKEQLCAAPGRNIHDGNVLIRDLVTFLRSKGIEGYLLSLDQRKAFDMVDRSFLFQYLDRAGIDRSILNVVKCLYTATGTRIQVNGHLSSEVLLERGVRQGCPLSATLYVLYLQAFINSFLRSERFRGLETTSGQTYKLTAYADDLLMFCSDESDVQSVFRFFDRVRIATGSVLNKSKTKILKIGNREGMNSEYLVDKIKVCGVWHHMDYERSREINSEECLKNVTKNIDKIKNISCTLRGRVLITNTVLYPKAYFTARTYPHTKSFIKKITSLVYSFLYGEGKRETFKRKVIEFNRKKGGLGLDVFESRCTSMFFEENFVRPARSDFDHQRLGLYRYFFSFQVRKIYDHLFTLSEPHCFHLPPVYKFSKLIWEGLKEKDDALSTAMVSAGQLYEWLKDDGDFEVKCRCLKQDLFDDEHYKALYALWCDSRIPVREIDFLWRTALGGLKTGEVVAKYRIPGTRLGCVFCVCELETTEHLFSECTGLNEVREIILESVERIGATVDRTDRQSVKEMCCTGLAQIEESKEIDRGVFRVVATANAMIWSRRNQLMFSGPGGGSLAIAVSLRCKDLCNKMLSNPSFLDDNEDKVD